MYIRSTVKPYCITTLLFVLWEYHKTDKRVGMPAVIVMQGEGHKVWGNAPKKSNSATCAHFHKRARCASKPNVFLFFGNFRGGENHDFS